MQWIIYREIITNPVIPNATDIIPLSKYKLKELLQYRTKIQYTTLYRDKLNINVFHSGKNFLFTLDLINNKILFREFIETIKDIIVFIV